MRTKLLLLATLLASALNITAQRYVGGDISMLPYYEAAHRTYYDASGTAISGDMIAYLKAQGWNSMRVRLFVDPVTYKTNNGNTYWNEGARQTLDDVKALGKRIKDAGLKFLLDIHYSDTWTDPDKHLAPQSWNSSSYATEVYDYTKSVLQTLVDNGATPDFIQVGNELNNGMLWDNLWASQASNVVYANDTDADMTNFISYIKKGCEACREVCPKAKIVFHVAMDYNSPVDGANWAAKTWPATLATYEVDYDIIGLSYYPYYHGPLNYLTTLLTYLKETFPTKEVQLVEVGYPHAWYPTECSYDYTGTYAATDDGQLAFTKDLISALASYNNVTGLYWWFPEANEYNASSSVTSGWYNYGLWDNSTGRAMQSVYQLYTFAAIRATIGSYGYASFSSTYPLDFTGLSGLTAYIATGSDGNKVTLQSVTGDMVANTGLVLKGNPGDYYIPVVASSDKWYDINSTPKNYLFAIDGSYTTLTKATSGTNYVLSVQGEKVVFAPIGNVSANVSAGQAALWIPSSGSGSRSLNIAFDDEASGIRAVERPAMTSSSYYNLNGQRFSSPKRGLYVVDGKKVIVR